MRPLQGPLSILLVVAACHPRPARADEPTIKSAEAATAAEAAQAEKHLRAGISVFRVITTMWTGLGIGWIVGTAVSYHRESTAWGDKLDQLRAEAGSYACKTPAFATQCRDIRDLLDERALYRNYIIASALWTAFAGGATIAMSVVAPKNTPLVPSFSVAPNGKSAWLTIQGTW